MNKARQDSQDLRQDLQDKKSLVERQMLLVNPV
jgi:hypothetical protein